MGEAKRALIAYYDERVATAKTWERHPLNTRALWLFRFHRFQARWGVYLYAALGAGVGVAVGALVGSVLFRG